MPPRTLALFLLALIPLLNPGSARAKSCVWKVSTPDGQHTLFLAGSVHALRRADHPLPAAYETAFAASQEIVFETDPDADILKRLGRVAELPDGSTLQEHLDPRTYAYVRRVLARTRGATDPEKKIARLRPWALAQLLEAPGAPEGMASEYGVDSFLARKARRARKGISGLVGLREHVDVFGGMSDAEGEVFLLLQFIHLDTAGPQFARLLSAWRRGDTVAIDSVMRQDYRAAPGLYRRLLTDRNQLWLPKLEGFLRGGRTRMVVAGAAHMAGEDGLPALLRARGYGVEQL